MEEDNLDYVGACIDEIALEGLDGITLSALWCRLQNRPQFPLSIDENSKCFVWDFVTQHPDVEFYELPQPRAPLALFNRYDYIDLDIGVVVEPENYPQDIYPFEAIEENGIRGSCTTFRTRKNITNEIRDDDHTLLSLQIAIKNWGEKLVLVASQDQRNATLLGTELNPNLKLNSIQYCMLERIGRSRYHGELTQGKTGLTVFKLSAKTMYYYRKLLMEKHLITKQLHYERNYKGQTVSGSLLHLKRFYVERRSKIQLILKKLSEVLSKKPDQREVFLKLRSELGVKETTFKKLFQKTFQQFAKVYLLPYREVFPHATDKEAKFQNGNEKLVKMVQLVKPYDQSDDEEDKESNTLNEIYFNPKNFLLDRSMLSQIFSVIKSKSPEGITAREIGRRMGIPRLEMRLLCNNLERRGVIATFMHDVGRQRVTKYIAKEFEKENEMRKMLLAERKKILDISEQCQKQLETKSELNGNDIPEASQEEEYSYLPLVTVESDKDEIKTSSIENSFTEELKQIGNVKNRKESTQLSYRILKRANMIIEMVKNAKLIDDIYKVQRMIYETETQEGYDKKIDKKSVIRLVHKLAEDGYIRSFRIKLTLGDDIKKLHFVCDPSITINDPSVKMAIEQAKFKYFASKETTKLTQPKQKEVNTIDESIKELQQLCRKDAEQAHMQYMPSIGRTYGLEPKFIRMKTLYTFLFYLVYDYRGKFSNNIDGPPVYHDETGWKMFIPPIRHHPGVPEGWCLICDVLLCMPLSILIRVVNITYKIEGLEEYLDDPIKQHYLIRQLPDRIRNAVMHNRRYIFSVFDVATKLSFIGLISLGPQQHKEKDQCFIYIHKCTSIKDTTVSKTGYIHISDDIQYSVRYYYLKTLEDVEGFWIDLQTVCMHTPLGSYNSARGRCIKIENIYYKPAMVEASRNKEFENANDDGRIPGDGCGAAGLDSAFFAHLKRNWSWPSVRRHLQNDIQRFCQKDNGGSINANVNYMHYLLGNNSTTQTVPNRRRRLSRLKNFKQFKDLSIEEIENNLSASKTEVKKRKIQTADENNSSPKKRKKPDFVFRILNRKLPKKRKPYYDDKDKDALKQMQKLRVYWTTQEDSILLMCKVASCLLDPTYNGMVVPFTYVRDILHKRLPHISKNKTSRACQRRVRYMLLNPTTSSNVSVFLCEARQDKELKKFYEDPKLPKTQETLWARKFTELLTKLLDKFTQSASDRSESLVLPQTIEQLHTDYQLSTSGKLPDCKSRHQDLHSIADINKAAVYSLILASLFASHDKHNWSFVLYKLYQQYPASMLSEIVQRIRHDHIVTKLKGVGKNSLVNLPLTSVPYRFTVTFKNALMTQYQPEIYHEAYTLLDNLIKESNQYTGIEVYKDVHSGHTSAVVSMAANFSLMFELQIPDQIIALDNTLSDTNHSEIAKKMEEMESQECIQKFNDEELNDLPDSDMKLSDVSSESVVVSPSGSSEPPSKKMRFENKETLIQNIDHDYTPLLKPATDSSLRLNSNVSFESCGASTSRASRLALYLMRQTEEMQKDRPVHSQDCFVINSCQVFCKFRDQFVRNLKHDGHNKHPILWQDVIYKIIDSQRLYLPAESPLFESIYDFPKFDNDEKRFAKEVYTLICEKKELGVTKMELMEKFHDNRTLEKQLIHMTNNWLIIKVGITCFRYVSYHYSKPWVLSSVIVPKDRRVNATSVARDMIESEKLQDQQNLDVNQQVLDTSADKVFPTLNTTVNQTVDVTTNIDETEQSNALDLSINNTGESATEIIPPVDVKGSKSVTSNTQVNESTETAENEVIEIHNTDKQTAELLSSCNVSESDIMTPSTNLTQMNSENTLIQYFLTQNEHWEKVQFVGRYWRKPDGSLNHSVLNNLLCSVFGHIMAYPGITEQQVCDHFMLAMQPIQVLELIEILERAECVTRFFLESLHPVSLFSKPNNYSISFKETIHSVCHVEATSDAIIKFSQLSEVLVNKRGLRFVKYN